MRVSVPACRQGEIREGFGRLVTHPEALEGVQGALRRLRTLIAQVQFQVHFRLIEIAQALVVRVASAPANDPGSHGRVRARAYSPRR